MIFSGHCLMTPFWMNWRCEGKMANKICFYLAEGECEEKLLKALKQNPPLITPGRVKKFNLIQNELRPSHLMTFPAEARVVLVYDTDKEITDHLRRNLDLLNSQYASVEVITVPQVLNFEDEIERSTDVTKAQDLTQSTNTRDFKSAVNRMKEADFRRTLKRHKLEIEKLWSLKPPKQFSFTKQQSAEIKIKK